MNRAINTAANSLLDSPLVLAILAIAALVALFGLLGVLLGLAGEYLRVPGNPLVEKVDALLPQTQCGQCGYPGCRPYAEAIENGDEINKCPPGGDTTIAALAELLGRDPKPLDGEAPSTPLVAYIREDECIGCTKCIQACPVDAILGAAKHMHTVIIDECTGCDLCVEPCPVDCIDMLPHPRPTAPISSPARLGSQSQPAMSLIASDRDNGGIKASPQAPSHG
ncbi:electron transport complex subunit RsxB [Halomonas halocynthiae]|uniref:electron transport complex subunit RsxB n=1 Tax=Halomonas halocynthiae TaxID=176290 RepID=UPI00041DFC3F|nr:electron transport complex subunit RsxB [Halomonas halocynthiae]